LCKDCKRTIEEKKDKSDDFFQRYASFDRHKFVFRRNAKSVASVVRSRAASCYSDARSINVVQPLSSSKQRLFQVQSKRRSVAFVTFLVKVLGTPNYMAREILMEQEQGYDSACDWWSVGCIIFELL
jgi:serine/threonine protein kinase